MVFQSGTIPLSIGTHLVLDSSTLLSTMALSKHAKALKSSPLKHLPRYLQEMQQPPLHRTYLRQRLQHQLLHQVLPRQ
ncbi:hypothetical protein Goklo_023841 [Gossypium klotzschianum]|uniref:Uncharacterized protein n=1 Tax=Gossypium klotzschianum TaxID=34286 RepID=A0A7J8W6Y2_9ROSI|nr:hypothetical protein [Gossypium klotzschianum]